MDFEQSKLETILKSYISNYKHFIFTRLEQYPHIYYASSNTEEYILKILDNDRNYNTLFDVLSLSTDVLLPCKTISGEYYTISDNKACFLYKKKTTTFHLPSPELWAKIIYSIHKLPTNFSILFVNIDELITQTKAKLKEAQTFLSDSEYSTIVTFFSKCNQTEECYYQENVHQLVISINDPSNNNLVLDKDEYKLIDMEKSTLNYREFDIQHLMWNLMLESNSNKELLLFWKEFKYSYESISNTHIDGKLLKKLYVLDYTRTLLWLHAITQTKERADYKRQKTDLNIIKKKLTTGDALDLFYILGE